MDTDKARDPEQTAAKTRKPRESGRLEWFVELHDDPPELEGIHNQPDHADQTAARKWLAELVIGSAGVGVKYTLCRVLASVQPRIEISRKAVLTP